MYTEFFGLNEKPFSITPDPRYLYMSQRHTDALAHLIYGISESGGFIQLTGEVGTGKTTLIRSLLEQLPEKAEIALILNPQLSTKEFLQVICEELRCSTPREDSIKAWIDVLNARLLRAHAGGRRVVLIVDEAQNLSTELLEQVRLLTNLETAKQKLLQIILIGQPELRDVLARPDMRQIAQRVTGRFHLEPLGREETRAYVKHRIRVAGSQADIFSRGAMRELYRRSRGVPRLINVIADRALLAAYAVEQSRVQRKLVHRAAAEVFGHRPARAWWRWAIAATGVVGIAILTSDLWRPAPVAEPQAAPAMEEAAPATAAQRVEPAAAVPSAESAPRLAELLSNTDLTTDTDSALHDLFALWGADYEPAGAPACAQAEAQGLRCLHQRGSIAHLRRVNRPAILSLTDEHGRQYQLVVSSLGSNEAQLLAGGHAFRVELSDLLEHWYGDHLLLWKPGTPEARDLIPGMRHEGVLWLRESLAQIRGETLPGTEPLLYDPALEARVREYQRERSLTVDGIVGTQTQIALSTDLAVPGTPVLIKRH